MLNINLVREVLKNTNISAINCLRHTQLNSFSHMQIWEKLNLFTIVYKKIQFTYFIAKHHVFQFQIIAKDFSSFWGVIDLNGNWRSTRNILLLRATNLLTIFCRARFYQNHVGNTNYFNKKKENSSLNQKNIRAKFLPYINWVQVFMISFFYAKQ